MIKDGLEWLKEFFTNQAVVKPVKLDFPKTKRKTFYWDPQLKSVDELDDSPPDLRHTITTVESLVDWVKDCDIECSIFVGENKITVDQGIDRIITMPFRKTPLWELLEKLVDEPSLKQAEAIKLVRQEFGPFDVGQTTLAACRSLKISSDTESIQESQAARFGKSIVAATVGGDAMPDKLIIEAKPYQHSELTRTVEVFLSVDFNKAGCIRFEPNEAEMMEAIEDEVDAVYQSLSAKFANSETVFVYQGEYRVE
jgi:hypothetical protein